MNGELNFFIKDGDNIIPFDATPRIVTFDSPDVSEEESVIDQHNYSFTIDGSLSRFDSLKLLHLFDLKTKLPRKLKKKLKNNKP